jgi:acetyl-CoA acetyltransferase
MTSDDNVYIVGLGLHPFGRHPGVTGLDMGVRAVKNALEDAGVAWNHIDFAVGGSNTAKPDALVGRLGLTGVAFASVRNGCATGGVALATAANALRAGEADIALAVGFDKHERGAFNSDAASYGLGPWYPRSGLMVTTQFFAMRARRYMYDCNIDERTLALPAVLASRAGAANPAAWRGREFTVSDVLSASMVSDPLTQLMFCQPNEGAVAVVLARGKRAFDLCERPVRLAAVAIRTRGPGSFEVYAPSLSVDRADGPSVTAAAAAFAAAGVGLAEVEIAQVQDTDCGSALIALAETGLCGHGAQSAFLEDHVTAPTAGPAINTDGGCLANGEPIGASGLRQIREVALQLQGRPTGLAVAQRPRVGFTHVYGAPGVSACAVLTTMES